MRWIEMGFLMFAALGLPILASIFLVIKQRSWIKAISLGALGFIVSQVLIRIPILQLVLARESWFIALSFAYPWMYLLVLSFSAGLFEEWARVVIMRYLYKGRSRLDALALGLGHGGIEAILLVGIPALMNLAVITFPMGYYAGFERISAIMLHITLSLIVMQAMRMKQTYPVWIAIFIHTWFNFSALGLIRLGVSLFWVELYLFTFSLSLFIWVWKGRSHEETHRSD